mmetsp:Transcript_24487/g.75532  ORF Transcript_24487/g.75532 Transcript_24487/m.75532 type:complete len:247 (+) Transcript_24487:325-1065(+)
MEDREREEDWSDVLERTPWAWTDDLAAPTATARGLVVHCLLRVEGDGVTTCDKTQFAALARLRLKPAWLGVEQDLDDEELDFEEAMANLSRNVRRDPRRWQTYAAATEALTDAILLQQDQYAPCECQCLQDGINMDVWELLPLAVLSLVTRLAPSVEGRVAPSLALKIKHVSTNATRVIDAGPLFFAEDVTADTAPAVVAALKEALEDKLIEEYKVRYPEQISEFGTAEERERRRARWRDRRGEDE